MILAVAGPVLVECDVEDPVQAVLDAPVGADGAGEGVGRQPRGGQAIAPAGRGFAVALDLGLDHDRAALRSPSADPPLLQSCNGLGASLIGLRMRGPMA